jgi:glycerophosphoryl diester phosphodiesterase
MEVYLMTQSINYAHRGFSGEYPENTMLAFKKAVEAGCDGIETDVQLTKDGVAVLCHDETLDRTTKGKGLLSKYTYSELCDLDAGIKFGKKFKGEKIPTLDELLLLCKNNNILINIELKNGIVMYDSLEKIVIDKVIKFNMLDKCILSSFNHYSMVACKEINPEIKTGLLYTAGLYKPSIYGKYTGADALHPFFYSVLHKEVVDDIKSANLKINAYTVDEEAHMKALINLGIDGIITNYPNRLAAILKNK